MNGEKYKKRTLIDKDKIKFGNKECIFRSNMSEIIIEEEDVEEEENEFNNKGLFPPGSDDKSIIDQY
jgi:hypothetical protein